MGRTVIAMGSVKGTRNPSALLMSHIRRARKNEPGEASDEVEEFIRNCKVDEAAASALRLCPLEVQRIVIASPEGVKGTQNPSAMLMSHIRRARQYEPGEASDEVEEFIRICKVDEAAASALRLCPLEVQRIVIVSGEGVKDAQNPSAMLMSQIARAHKRW